MSPEEVANRKRDILYQFDRLERNGIRLPRRFTMDDALGDMRAELDRIKLDREVDVSVKFQRRMLMTMITGVELANKTFDPLSLKLDGWSDSINETLPDYDEIFEELHLKYRGKAKMAPELKLLLMVGGSGVMFHLTNAMFRQSSVVNADEVLRQNPGLRRQFAQAASNMQYQQPTPPQQQQRQQQPGGGMMGGMGGMLGMLGGLFGGGGGGGGGGGMMQPQQQQQQQAPPQSAMRGPKPVDDVLRELHQSAFPGGSPGHGGSARGNRRVEVISNTSDSELSELPDDAISSLGVDTGGGASRRGRAPRVRTRR